MVLISDLVWQGVTPVPTVRPNLKGVSNAGHLLDENDMEPVEFKTRPQRLSLNPFVWMTELLECMANGFVCGAVVFVLLMFVDFVTFGAVRGLGRVVSVIAFCGFCIGIAGIVVYKIKRMSDSHGTRWIISNDGITIYKWGARAFSVHWGEITRLELDDSVGDGGEGGYSAERAMIIKTKRGKIRLSDDDFELTHFFEMRRLIRLMSPPASKKIF